MAVTVEGTRDILGIWAGDGGEGAKYWLHVFTELKNRGVNDVLMLVCDGLKGLPEAVETVWPRTIVQTCVVHLLRNSFRYAARQDWDKIAKALKPVYTAPSEDAATGAVLGVPESLGRQVSGDREAVVGRLGRVRALPVLRRRDPQGHLLARTPSRASTPASARPSAPADTSPTRHAALKCVYMALMSLDPTGKGRKRWTMRWKAPLNAFQIAFEGRLTPNNTLTTQQPRSAVKLTHPLLEMGN